MRLRLSPRSSMFALLAGLLAPALAREAKAQTARTADRIPPAILKDVVHMSYTTYGQGRRGRIDAVEQGCTGYLLRNLTVLSAAHCSFFKGASAAALTHFRRYDPQNHRFEETGKFTDFGRFFVHDILSGAARNEQTLRRVGVPDLSVAILDDVDGLPDVDGLSYLPTPAELAQILANPDGFDWYAIGASRADLRAVALRRVRIEEIDGPRDGGGGARQMLSALVPIPSAAKKEMPLGEETIIEGDSGGPVFVNSKADPSLWRVVAATSGGTANNALIRGFVRWGAKYATDHNGFLFLATVIRPDAVCPLYQKAGSSLFQTFCSSSN